MVVRAENMRLNSTVDMTAVLGRATTMVVKYVNENRLEKKVNLWLEDDHGNILRLKVDVGTNVICEPPPF